jgi:SAM-dependent methyltransferase
MPNAAQAEEWNGPSGAHRTKHSALIDNEIARHNERFRAVAAIEARDRVLDIGCGTGESTREAARAAVDGSVVGVDLSDEMLDRARGMSVYERLDNVTFIRADAQVHEFPAADFDVCLSRFGSMFFDDPVAAFTNIGRALRPGARLVLIVWQARERNEWSTSVAEAFGVPAPTAKGPGAFALADPAEVADILEAAGFDEVTATHVHVPVCYGPDVATAYDLTVGLRSTRDLLATLDPDERAPALQRLRLALAAHEIMGQPEPTIDEPDEAAAPDDETGETHWSDWSEDEAEPDPPGIYFDSRSWIVTAVRS